MTEGPYKLPEGWRWVRLGEVARREAALLKPSDYPSRRFRYIGMEHVAPGQWEEPEGVEINGGEIKSQVVVFHPGLVLYGKLRPYLNKVVVPHTEGVASTEFVPIVPLLDVLDPEYLGAFLRTPSFVDYASANTTGSRQPRTRLDVLWNTPIPLPPLAEQRRIVARIEELLGRVREARRLRQEAQKDAERLWQSVLAQTFPRPGSDLPKDWRWVQLGKVCTINPRRPRLQREPGIATTFIAMSAVDDESGTIVAAEERPFEQVKSGYTYFEENDVLFAKITPCMENGKAAIARGLLGGIGFGSTEFHVLRPHASVVPEWIWLFVRQERFREDAKKSFRGGVGQQRVPQEFLKQYLTSPSHCSPSSAAS
jgi:type I restriction enzyme S subunit